MRERGWGGGNAVLGSEAGVSRRHWAGEQHRADSTQAAERQLWGGGAQRGQRDRWETLLRSRAHRQA